jgi:NitT/TauT family transport system permease protein
MRMWLDRLAVVAVLLLLWQGVHWLSPFALASPWATAAKLAALLQSPGFWPHVTETGKAFCYALLIAVAAGLGAGLLIGISRRASEVMDPLLASIYGVPKVTLYPLILLIFGLGLPAKVAFGALHSFFPIALFTLNGVRKLPPVYVRAARVMRLTRAQTIATIVLPAALPEIVAGLRIGVSLTLLGVLIGEMFASQRGLGFLIMNAIGQHDTETMLAVTTLLAIVAVAVNIVLLRLDHRLHQRAAVGA